SIHLHTSLLSDSSYLFSNYLLLSSSLSFFFFNVPAPTEIYTLSLHDALPISKRASVLPPIRPFMPANEPPKSRARQSAARSASRSEEHTSELQSRFDLVCRLLLEKKKKQKKKYHMITQTKYTQLTHPVAGTMV